MPHCANALAVLALARTAGRVSPILLHYSTDFVFDGESDRPYTEEDRPNPRSLYSTSKLLRDWFAADAAPAYVLHVDLFGHPRPNGARRGLAVDFDRGNPQSPIL
jgi:dTDP-4-dehydrorhamnose reductase